MSNALKRLVTTADNTFSLVELLCAAGVFLVGVALAGKYLYGWLAGG